MIEMKYTCVSFFLICASNDISILLNFEAYFKDVKSGLNVNEK